jgi:hypothetical protein
MQKRNTQHNKQKKSNIQNFLRNYTSVVISRQ